MKKKVFNIEQVIKKLKAIKANEADIKRLKKAMTAYNEAAADLNGHIEGMPDYTLCDLISDLDVKLEEIPLSTSLVSVWDNGGETFDRYDIILRKSGETFGASENPSTGFGQYAGNICQFIYSNMLADKYYKNGAYVRTWVLKSYSEYIYRLRKRGFRPVRFHKLPAEVQQYIEQIVN